MQQNRKEIRKEILILIIPIIMENILSIFAGVVSTALVGRLTSLAISSQGVVFRITNVFAVLWDGLRIGAMVCIARLYGEEKFLKSKQAFQTISIVTLSLGAIFQLVLLIAPMPFLTFFTKDVEILSAARSYMNIVVLGFPFLIMTRFNSATFQGYGDTKTPMLLQLLINIVNIVAGYLFIFVLKLDLLGAGLATVLSQITGAVVGLYLMYRKNGLFKKAKGLVPFGAIDKDIIKETYSTGIPAAVESSFWQISAIIMSKIVLSYGLEVFAAYNLGTQAELITELPVLGFTVAATALAGKAFGKKDPYLFKAYYNEQLKMNGFVSLLTSLLLIFLPGMFMAFVTNNSELQAIGKIYLIIMGLIQIPQNIQRTFKGTLYAVGYNNVPMYISGFATWIIRIPLALVATYVFKFDLIAIWIIIAVDQILRCLMCIIFIKKKRVLDCVELEFEKESSVIANA